ncbi:MAG: segregation/condensation protein A [Clostridia bacterium]|nr:segregation/condensation protein A [Clostridia bacterium]
MNPIIYRIDQFEGPLDVLLQLIRSNQMDINDIPIALLCDQYLDYIRGAEEANIELSAEFIVMATELMRIKSRMLLPIESPEEEDPRAALAQALIEYERAKNAAELLYPRFDEYGSRMIKDTDEISIDKKYVADQDLDLLLAAYKKAMANIAVSDEDSRKRFEPLIRQKIVTVAEVADHLGDLLRKRVPVSLGSYFSEAKSRSELVSMFMALLEVLKSGFMNLKETREDFTNVIPVFSDVTIEIRPSVTDEEFNHLISDMKLSEF